MRITIPSIERSPGMLTESKLRYLLRKVRSGDLEVSSAMHTLRYLPTDRLPFARLDTHRRIRLGIPEAVLCEGKTPSQLAAIARRFLRMGELGFFTRLSAVAATRLQRAVPALRYYPLANLGTLAPSAKRARRKGFVIVVSAGTSDIPVAEEARLTLEWLGSRARGLYDVGVAGIHRVLSALALMRRAQAMVVVAGMEGALASVVAGLVRCPVIAVPTSVGYGAGAAGVSPLLAMLNSCAPGVGLVNIDNGFGAGCLAHMINMASCRAKRG